MAVSDDAENLVDRRVRRQRAVEYGKLSLQTLRDIVPATTRVDHGRYELLFEGITSF